MNKRVGLSVGQRLTIGFGIAGLLSALVVAWSFVRMESTIALRDHLVTVVVPRADAATELERSILYIGIRIHAAAVLGGDADQSQVRLAMERADWVLATLGRLPYGSEGSELLTRIRSRYQHYRQTADVYLGLVESGAESNHVAAAQTRLDRHRESLLEPLRLFVDRETRIANDTRNQTGTVMVEFRNLLLVLFLIVVVASLGTGVSMSRAVARPVRHLASAARALEEGDYGPATELALPGAAPDTRDELRALAHGFGRMASAMQHRERRMSATARLASSMASSLDTVWLCNEALEQTVAEVEAEVGAVYVRHSDGTLRRQASYALDAAEEVLQVGEGVPGQAVAGSATVVVRDIPHDTPFKIRFGFDHVPPRCVVAVPLMIRGEARGVLLLGALRDLSPDSVAYVERAAAQLALGVEGAEHYERAQQLARTLAEKNDLLQVQNEELQAQSEELQAQGEELQAQSEELQAQSEELQAQSEELQAQNEELQAQTEGLSRAEANLRAADQRKDAFLAVLSHELRNPLAPIRNSIQVLNRSPGDSEPAVRAREIIARQIEHLTRLVEDLLDVTRITRGKVVLRMAPVDLRALLEQCAEDCRSACARAGTALQVRLPDQDVWVTGDAPRLAQIVGNLLNNACKFTPDGGRIRLVLWVDVASSQAKIQVTDTGPGIARDLRERVFEPFTQAESTLARSQGGLGLGLALVKGLVDAHGGSIEVHCDGPEPGSTFTVSLPLVQAPAGGTDSAADHAPRSTGRRILVIEDNVDAGTSLRDILELLGHQVVVARDGHMGVAKAAAFLPDVVLCDIGLPGKDGYQVARELRDNPALAHTRLVALTGYAFAEDRAQALNVFHAHLAKPAMLEELERLLATFVDAPMPEPEGAIE